MTEPRRDTELASKIATVETGLVDLKARVDKDFQELEQDIGSVSREMRSLAEHTNNKIAELGATLSKSIDSLREKLSEATKPAKFDTQTAVAVILLVIAIGTLVLRPMQRDDKRLEDRIVECEHNSREHEKLTLHPVGKQRIDALEISLREATHQNDKNLMQLQAQFDDIKIRGVQVTQERLGILEHDMKRLNKEQ